MDTQKPFDLAVIGAGIVGLTTAWAIMNRNRSLRIVVLEKEADVARHQTGHNSGVLHAGLYYKPGSLKAQLSVAGKVKMQAFCDEHGIAYDICGKVVVALDAPEAERLQRLHDRGTANGVPGLRKLSGDELREIEPHSAGIAALHSPGTGIISYGDVARKLRALIEAAGGEFRPMRKVTAITSHAGGLRIQCSTGDVIEARDLIACAGLYADRVARLMGAAADVRVVPFRGEYFFVREERKHLVKGLIYPVPDPGFPFLGVHFTKTIHGGVEAGPNAVFALSREGYSWGRISARDLLETLAFPGFRKFAARHWRMGLGEMRRSLNRAEFVAALRRLVPDLRQDDVVRGGSGVRAQALSTSGDLLDDFHFVELPHALHVINAPSPAATASLAIGEHIAERAARMFAI